MTKMLANTVNIILVDIGRFLFKARNAWKGSTISIFDGLCKGVVHHVRQKQ
ncbi:hypothetical protein Mapa_009735 [Marchantia paleacea]|nr:hypothetical protein Mapa_009735 [Marchantia paleacea]